MIGQLLCHLWGDYILQSDWMAQNKTKHWRPALVHSVLYSATFLLLGPSWKALAVIWSTHYLIDRYRLARDVVWLKNWMGPAKSWFFIPAGSKSAHQETYWTTIDEGIAERFWKAPVPPLCVCPTGYPPNSPPWLSTWLLIIADNTLHLTINYLALRYL